MRRGRTRSISRGRTPSVPRGRVTQKEIIGISPACRTGSRRRRTLLGCPAPLVATRLGRAPASRNRIDHGSSRSRSGSVARSNRARRIAIARTISIARDDGARTIAIACAIIRSRAGCRDIRARRGRPNSGSSNGPCCCRATICAAIDSAADAGSARCGEGPSYSGLGLVKRDGRHLCRRRPGAPLHGAPREERDPRERGSGRD